MQARSTLYDLIAPKGTEISTRENSFSFITWQCGRVRRAGSGTAGSEGEGGVVRARCYRCDPPPLRPRRGEYYVNQVDAAPLRAGEAQLLYEIY